MTDLDLRQIVDRALFENLDKVIHLFPEIENELKDISENLVSRLNDNGITTFLLEFNDLENQIDRLNERLDDLEDEKDRLLQEVEEHEESISRYQNELEELVDEIDSLKDSNTDLESEVQELRSRLRE